MRALSILLALAIVACLTTAAPARAPTSKETIAAAAPQHAQEMFRWTGWKTPSSSLLIVCLTVSLAIVTAYLMGRQARSRFDNRTRHVDAALLEQSHRAGMAEVASGVIHNVGNVLNNVTVASALLREKLHKSEITDLNRVLDIVEQQQHRLPEFLSNDPRGKQLPQYLLEAGRALKTERFEMLTRVETLCKSVEHIADIIRVQKQHAKADGVRQQVFIHNVVDDALEMSSVLLERHSISTSKQGVASDLRASLDRQRLLQILVNLISNAVQAIVRANINHRQIRIAASRENGQLHLTITDNGAGISAENLPRIFHHAFTTRKDGQGLGLHDSALTAAGMGGRLSAQSDGPGCGATFLLTTPLGDAASAS